MTTLGPRTFAVTIQSDAVSAFTWLEAADVVGRFSDNGFLLTKPLLVMTFYAEGDDVDAEQLFAAISVTTLYNIYVG